MLRAGQGHRHGGSRAEQGGQGRVPRAGSWKRATTRGGGSPGGLAHSRP